MGALALPFAAMTTSYAQAGSGASAQQTEERTPPEVAYLAKERGVSHAEAAKRIGWQTRAVEGRDGLENALGTSFAGVWIHPETDRPQVASTTSPAETRSKASRQLHDAALADVADVVQVTHDLGALEAQREALASDLTEINNGGTAWIDVSVSESRNRVLVAVPAGARLTQAQQDFVDEALRSQMVERVEQATTGTGRVGCGQRAQLNCDPPLRGGPAILVNNSNGCTAGFNTRAVDGTAYLMTAGHCFAAGTIGVSSRMLDDIEHYIGLRHNSAFSPNGDYGIVRINDAGTSGWNIRAWVAVTNSPANGGVTGTNQDWEYPIKATGGTLDNMRVCTTGAYRTATSCGQVLQRDVPFTYSSGATGTTVRVEHLARTNFCGQGGDSGAPVYAGNTAYGLQVAGATECDSYYQGITGAENAMNVKVARSG